PGTFAVPESATTDDNYDFSGGIGVEGNAGDKNFCNAYDGNAVIFKNVYAKQAGTYKAVIPVDYSYGNSFIKITVADVATSLVEAEYNGLFTKNNSQWELIDFDLTGTVTEGLKNVTFAFTLGGGDRFAGNFKAPEFVWTGEGEVVEKPEIPAGYAEIPGAIAVVDGSYSSANMLQGNGTASPNVGNVMQGSWAEYKVYATEEGVYAVNNIAFYWANGNEADIVFTVTDEQTQKLEAKTTYHFDGVGQSSPIEILLDGCVTVGTKILRMEIINVIIKEGNNRYVTNWRDFSLTKLGEKLAKVSAVTAESLEATEIEGYDWSYNIPLAYDAATVSFKVVSENASLTVKEGENVLEGVDGVYTIATPAGNEQTEVT
ncbi:MAG: hypothetical protein K2F78_00975, partial [Muribaculaceae bacterium]|nr:hypothetical protein [Muribaculaceae bacterium]